MEFYQAFLLGLVLILICYAVWFYMRPMGMHKIVITELKFPPCAIMYRQFQGSYLSIKEHFDKLQEILAQLKMPQVDGDDKFSGKNLSEVITETICIFYDDPEALIDENDSRAIYGFIIPKGLTKEQKEFIQVQIENQHGYAKAILGDADCLHGQVPNEEYFYYVLRSLEFQPIMKGDPVEMRKKYQKHAISNLKCKIEAYNKETIHFYLIASNFEQFQLTTLERGYMKPADYIPQVANQVNEAKKEQ